MSARHSEAIGSLEAIGSSARRRALVIINPYATTVSDRLRNVVVSALASRYRIEAVETRARGHATELAATAVGGDYDLVVAFGGDGTVNEVANGLAGSDTPLTPLPGGSANVFCKLLGVPAEIVDATAHLLALADHWQPREVDLGFVAGRHYTFSAGVGIDASVVRQVDAHPGLKRRYGPSFFLASALWTFSSRYLRDPPQLRVSAEGATIDGVTAIVQNAEHYTYFKSRAIDMADGATLSNGTLAGLVLRRGALRDVPSLLVRGVAGGGRVAAYRGVATFATSESAVIASTDGRALPLQLDGDYIADVLEARFTIRPGALRVLA
ncbi:MAG TPA: diacylglycerol kinase family protein [Solirubrobacteraceae bacterium]|nr:diacylglycerol kinase family protein [Solirubrobacteraceae bacterium]